MSDDFDFDAEFADALPVKPKRKKPIPKKPATAKVKQRADISSESHDALCRKAASGRTVYEDRDFFMPCSANFFARVLHLDQMTVNRRLRRVPPESYDGTRPVWEFGTALPYLIKSQMDMKTYRESMTEKELPLPLQKAVWEAKRQRLAYLKEAGQTWATERVIALNSQTTKEIGEMMELWFDTLSEGGKHKTGLEVLERLQDQIGELRSFMYQHMVELPEKSKTLSIFGESDSEFQDDAEAETLDD